MFLIGFDSLFIIDNKHDPIEESFFLIKILSALIESIPFKIAKIEK